MSPGAGEALAAPVASPRSLRRWPIHERPRERLRALGGRGLADRELLAILVGSGTAGGSAMTVAEGLLERYGGSLRALASAPTAALEEVAGVGEATAARVAAAMELGRRAGMEAVRETTRIRGPADVHAWMGPLLQDLPHEEFHALLLTTQHRVIRQLLITRGILDASLIHPREVFRPAIAEGAAAIVLVHNHPSGDPTPSQEDRAVTRQLREAGRTVGIPVLDHVVIGHGRWASVVVDG